MKYKDDAPENTVKKLVTMFNRDFDLTFSSKKSNNGEISHSYVLVNYETGLITNGKGTTEAYALASAYGEFYERFFNLAFMRFGNTTPNDIDEKYPTVYLERKQTIEEIQRIIEMETGKKEIEMVNQLIRLIDAYYGFAIDHVPCIHFKNREKEQLYIPVALADFIIGTNGMAAGNSYEEAFVQGFSEILERYAIKELNNGNIIPDLIGEKVDSAVYTNFTKKINMIGTVDVFEFTFERKLHFPVVLLLIIDKKNGIYKFKFGAHCTMYYALERCITEIVQGADLDDFNKWIPVERSVALNNGENMAIYTDGSGALSRIALENLLSVNQTYNSTWNPKSNIEAYDKINKSYKDIYVCVQRRNPLYSIEVYIPKLTLILIPTYEKLNMLIDEYKISRLFVDLIHEKEMTVEKIENVVIQAKNSYKTDRNLSEIVKFICPIQKQYLKHISLDDLEMICYLKNEKYDKVSEYFEKKIKTGERSEYNRYAFIYSKYKHINKKIPMYIDLCFKNEIRESVSDNFENNYEKVYNLNYCIKCKCRETKKCILYNKKRICNILNNS